MSTNLPESPQTASAKAQAGRNRKWCFTINKYNEEHLVNINALSEQFAVHGIISLGFQEEIAPSTGMTHIQGYVCFKTQRTMASVKKLLKANTAHLEIMRGTLEQNITYISKDKSAKVNGTRTIVGETESIQGSRTDLKELHTRIMAGEIKISDVMCDYPQLYCQYKNGLRDMCDYVHGKKRNYKSNVTVHYGDSGTGKSRDAMTDTDAYVLRCSKTGVWFDGYDYNNTLIIDDFYGWIPFNMLLNLLDRYPMKVDIKGGAMEFNSKKIIITSNKSPIDWYPNLSDEHKIALLRRLDCIMLYERSGTIDVTQGCIKYIENLKAEAISKPSDVLKQLLYSNVTPTCSEEIFETDTDSELDDVYTDDYMYTPTEAGPLLKQGENDSNDSEVVKGNTDFNREEVESKSAETEPDPISTKPLTSETHTENSNNTHANVALTRKRVSVNQYGSTN